MKLIELKSVIHSDLQIIDHSTNEIYEHVDTHSDLFASLGDKEVIGVRAYKNIYCSPYLCISVK